jgi:hypothetical protein
MLFILRIFIAEQQHSFFSKLPTHIGFQQREALAIEVTLNILTSLTCMSGKFLNNNILTTIINIKR